MSDTTIQQHDAPAEARPLPVSFAAIHAARLRHCGGIVYDESDIFEEPEDWKDRVIRIYGDIQNVPIWFSTTHHNQHLEILGHDAEPYLADEALWPLVSGKRIEPVEHDEDYGRGVNNNTLPVANIPTRYLPGTFGRLLVYAARERFGFRLYHERDAREAPDGQDREVIQRIKSEEKHRYIANYPRIHNDH